MTRTVIASDDFNRADGAIGSNWLLTSSTSFAAPEISGNKLSAVTFDQQQFVQWVGAGTFAEDQYSEATFEPTGTGSLQRAAVFVRGNGLLNSSFNRYWVMAIYDTSSMSFQVFRGVGTTNTLILSGSADRPAVGTPYRIRLEVEGDTTPELRLYLDDVMVVSGTDTNPSPLISGAPGITLRRVSAANFFVDDWEGGNLSGGSTPVSFSGTIPTQNATEGTPFSVDLSSYFSGTETPFAYTVQSGTPPTGLTLNSSTGVISGTPTTPGTASGIVIRATDAGADTADSNAFSIVVAAADTTAPVLTSPTGTATGQTTATGTVSTDEANGTLYYLATTNSTESAATVKGGSSQAVTTTGEQSVSVTGLTAGTGYYLHYVHRDAAGNDSTVASSSLFTTDSVPVAVPGVRIQLHDGATEQASLTGLTVAWFDDPDPATMGAPVLQSATEATDASGWLEVDLDGYTALDVGDPGFLIVYKAGATAPDDIVFAGRLVIEDIG